MDASSPRWHRVTPSTFWWEDEAIDFLRGRIADADPNRGWSTHTSWCIVVHVTRTNIDLDDELVELAMRRYRLDSKRAAVQLALEKLVGEPMTRSEVLAMQGTGFDLTNDEVEALSDADPAHAG